MREQCELEIHFSTQMRREDNVKLIRYAAHNSVRTYCELNSMSTLSAVLLLTRQLWN